MQEEDIEKIGKYSLAVIYRECFSHIKAEFENYYVPFNMSFILFNSGKEMIEEEYILKQV